MRKFSINFLQGNRIVTCGRRNKEDTWFMMDYGDSHLPENNDYFLYHKNGILKKNIYVRFNTDLLIRSWAVSEVTTRVFALLSSVFRV